jgi:hypothetical protein
VDVDLFQLWRYLLMIFCTVYTIVRTGESFWRWYLYLWSGDRSTTVMRHYLWVQVLRLRVHRFTLELVQIVALSALFLAISWAHRYV